jgi:hypothetical protein
MRSFGIARLGLDSTFEAMAFEPTFGEALGLFRELSLGLAQAETDAIFLGLLFVLTARLSLAGAAEIDDVSHGRAFLPRSGLLAECVN